MSDEDKKWIADLIAENTSALAQFMILGYVSIAGIRDSASTRDFLTELWKEIHKNYLEAFREAGRENGKQGTDKSV